VGLNGQDQIPPKPAPKTKTIRSLAGKLGQAASADAVQMIGTVAMASPRRADFRKPAGQTPAADSENGDNSIPGQSAPAGFGGPGGPGGGAPGGGFGGGGRGGGGGAAHGADRRSYRAVGAQRVQRQRINRVHFSFYDTFGDSAFNARPYLFMRPTRQDFQLTESAGLNIGGPLKIPHVYDGTDKTFFYINLAARGREARWTNCHRANAGGEERRLQRGQHPAL